MRNITSSGHKDIAYGFLTVMQQQEEELREEKLQIKEERFREELSCC